MLQLDTECILDAFKGYDLDDDGYISRDELFRMFKAYFYLSMELVRDVVSAMEDDMMDNFEFSASQPVSAAFTVAIPSASSDEDDNTSQNEEQLTNNDAHRTRRHNTRKEDYFQQQYAQENRHQASKDASESSLSATSVQEEHAQAESPTNTSESNWLPSSDASPTFSVQSLTKKQQEDETMSQDAIEEMVEKTFRSIDTKREGYISYEEFKQFVQTDSSIVSWFEALGTVF
jgi:Ca2+-binding EF-hand superfamily protein